MAVSYTHLDVYKRQSRAWTVFDAWWRRRIGVENMLSSVEVPVEILWKDVYKRQPQVIPVAAEHLRERLAEEGICLLYTSFLIAAALIFTGGYKSVSYTHLDVYKRQA